MQRIGVLFAISVSAGVLVAGNPGASATEVPPMPGATPPGAMANALREPLEPVEHGLVNVGLLRPPPLQEIRYATTYNFTKEVLYPFPAVFLHRDAAAALEKVQQELAKEGLGLKVFDGYRPISVQRKMWDLIQDDRYVSNPNKGFGRHTRGTAVDVTLVDAVGNELKMPTGFDSFQEKAHRLSGEWSPEEKANSLKLEAVMKKFGFVPYPFEWWHYDLAGWENYPPLDISFEDLANGVTTTIPVAPPEPQNSPEPAPSPTP